ncbi:branched-chain amino acid ABC transporter permease [Brevibacterium sp. 50QC2O2]|jgi:branched-chain amino acid transport system permease protein|uniref:branched-chain amino acid ABC transporter permease n=1 Tax=Brevibacterium TaxID=1696 RepID=UPI00211C29B2|nr:MULTISPECIES: branched-chain amino acid ABC transporter permease [unclassified Brevibacterium]MCQ9366843.1 branched-chain amino acid ABC transporter permease [Brevibacterium sp. 91QC2O2]MCQ9383993.1 branched-chain amino acid ABC transporter permease [Brevibacterium sp. 68QC2CO]MCQ9389153.1 branched-chain amino acid ABC transporter permease [Brevibacterium sp. 50QC2O2]
MSMHNPNESSKALQKAAAKSLKHERKDLKPGGLRTWWSDRSRFQQWMVLLVPVVLAFLLPVINPPFITTEPGNDFAITCFNMAVYALVALGLNVVVGMAGLLDMGYIGFFAVGSYVAALWTSSDSTMIHIPYLWTLPLAMVVTMVFGIALGIPTLRLRGDYLAIVTLGFGEIIRILATILPPLKGQSGFQNIGAPPGSIDGQPIFFTTNGLPWYWLTLVIIIIVTILLGNLERSRVGRAWIAIREDEDAAETMGVPTFKFKLAAFATGAALGGLSGALMAGQVGFVNNQKFDVQTSVLFLAAVVLGGQGSKLGAIVGGAIVAYVPMRFTEIANYKFLIFGIVLVVLMLFRPQGLISIRAKLLTFGSRIRRFVRKDQDGSPSRAGRRSSIEPGAEEA